MTQKPAKPTAPKKRATAATAAEPAKPATRAKRATATTAAEPAKPATRAKRGTAATAATGTKPARRTASPSGLPANRRLPSYDEISERAYFISLDDDGGDEVANWLRAERELATP